MIRKRLMKSIGGYNDEYSAQDGYELWLNALHRYGMNISNVQTPLFFYRQHPESLSKEKSKIRDARKAIKKGFVDKRIGPVKPRVVAVIPAKNTYKRIPNLVLSPIAGKPLIDYTFDAVYETELFESVFVISDDEKVVDYCRNKENVITALRPKDLCLVKIDDILLDAIKRMEDEYNLYPDIVVFLSVNTPLRRAEHIREAFDTLMLYNCDSVVSVYEDTDVHYTHGREGLCALNKGMFLKLPLEKEVLFVDNNAIKAIWRDSIVPGFMLGRLTSHIVMGYEESIIVTNPLNHWLADQILRNGSDFFLNCNEKTKYMRG